MITFFYCHDSGRKIKISGPQDTIIKKSRFRISYKGSGNRVRKIPTGIIIKKS